MDNLKSLKALLEAVEKGEDTLGFAALTANPLLQCKVEDAYRGSLGGAGVLHKELLPDWRVWTADKSFFGYELSLTKDDETVYGFNKTCPARAYLSAIIKALIAIAEGKDNG